MKSALLAVVLVLPCTLFASVRGVVISQDGAALPDVRVSAFPIESSSTMATRLSSANPERTPIASVQTDRSGRFALDTKTPYLSIQLEASGYAPVALQAGSSEDLGAVALAPAPPVTGVVTAGGKPLPRATVIWRSRDGVELVRVTDEEGRYSIPTPRGWAVERMVIHPSFAPLLQRRATSDFTTAPITLVPGESITIALLGPDGKSAGPTDFLDENIPVAHTAEGALKIEHLPSGWKTLNVRSGELSATITRGSVPARLRLTPISSASVAIVDSLKKPIAGAIVLVREGGPSRNPFTQSLTASRRFIADARGAVTIPLLTGNYTLTLSTPGYEESSLTLQMPATGKVSRVLAASLTATASGSVVSEDKQPVAGAVVNFASEMGGRGRPGRMARRVANAVYTAPDGHFVMRGLTAHQEGHLAASRTGFPPGASASFSLSPGEVKSGVMILIPTGNVVAGRVVDSEGKALAGVSITATEDSGGGRRGGFGPGFGGGRRGGFNSGSRSEAKALRSAADGSFQIRLKEGDYDLQFEHAGFAAATRRVEVKKRNEPLQIQLQPGVAIEGRVVRNGIGIPNVAIVLMGDGGSPDPVVTGEDGGFRFSDLQPGSKTLLAANFEEFIQQTQQVQAPASGVLIQVPAGSTIHATVLDSRTKGPVMDFEASLSASRGGAGGGGRAMGGPPMSQSFHTMDGSFTLDNVPPGMHEVSVSAPSYATRKSTITIEAGRDATLEVNLDPGVSLTGRVTGPDGSALEGVSINVSQGSAGNGGPRFSPAGATTDASGEYQIDSMAEGEQVVNFTADGYLPEHRSIQVADQSVRLDVTLSSGLDVNGVVVNDAGVPIEGASVTSRSAVRDAGFPSATSDASGSFHFSGLPGGFYTFAASKAGLMDGSSGSVDISSRPLVRIVLGGGATIHGQVTGLSADELTRTTVRATGSDADASSPVDPSGNYRIKGSPIGTVRVSAIVGGLFNGRQSSDPKTVDVSAGSDVTVDFQFQSDNGLSGTVRQGGSPLAGATVTVRPTDPTVATRASAQTDGNGQYQLAGIDKGDYSVTVIDATRSISFQTSTSVNGATHFDIDVRTASLSGKIVDDVNGDPISGASVLLQPEEEGSGRPSSSITDDSGFYSVPGVTPGSYTIRAGKEGYAQQTIHRSLTDSGSSDVSFRLVKNDGATVTVVDGRNGTVLQARLTARDSSGSVVWAGGPGQMKSDGSFQVPIPPGSYTLRTEAQGYADRSTTLLIPSANIRIGMTPGGTLRIQSSASNPFTGVLVDAGNPNDTASLRTVTILPGTTTLQYVTPGSYRMNVLDSSGATVKSIPVTVQEGVVSNVSVD